jgi:hypothetical protein
MNGMSRTARKTNARGIRLVITPRRRQRQSPGSALPTMAMPMVVPPMSPAAAMPIVYLDEAMASDIDGWQPIIERRRSRQHGGHDGIGMFGECGPAGDAHHHRNYGCGAEDVSY